MRTFFGILWFAFLAVALYVYFFHSYFFQNQLEQVVQTSIYLAYAALLLLGCIRGFTLIPVTYLIILGLLFFPPLPLFIIIILGALVSSASVYYFFKFLDLDTLFEKKYGKQIDRVRQALVKNELPIIIGWSMFPFLPTDVICYICGTLEVDIKKLLLGVFIGESVMSGAYIFFGHYLLDYLHLVA
ncbi:MAG: VTT domain-containing protein [Minisyncoccia bacterium]